MKKKLFIYFFLLAGFAAAAQEKEKTSSATEQQLENLAEVNDTETEDDSYLQQRDHYKKHPLNLNTAGAEQLQELNILTGLQVQQFLAYRRLLGKLLNRYELQAVPSWNIETIKKLLPFIEVADNKTLAEKLKAGWTGGDAVFLMRYARVLEKSKGYDRPAIPGGSYYLGSRDKIYLRYKYNYKNLLQWGLLADKDAGEQLFKGRQKQGFDFYSFHFFARIPGIVKILAVGDFTVNFGQGLIQWQSMAFKKSAAVLSVKRQSATLRPYNSAGEYNFHRGIGTVLQRRNWEATFFASRRKISANNVPDTANGAGAVSSFQAGGYHRTASENEDRNSLRQFAAGANIKYQGNSWHAGISSVYYNFSKPVQKSGDPYHVFALHGASLINTGIDYACTWRNIHLFGEAAADSKFNKAFLHGAVISMDTRVDVSVVYRNIDRGYQSLHANAFTENTFPVNENGLYAGLCLRPANTLKIDAYADVFQFPWLKYRVSAPSTGKDYFIQFTYTPGRHAEIYLRYKNEAKMINRTGTDFTTQVVDWVPKKNLRLQTSIDLNRQLTFKSRVEVLWYQHSREADAGQGFLGYTDIYYKPAFKNWSANMRLQYFETSGYNARIYAYEADLPYNFSIPFFDDKGIRYYFNMNWDAARMINIKRKKRLNLDVWLKWSQTIYSGKTVLGGGLDQIRGNRRSEFQFQLIISK